MPTDPPPELDLGEDARTWELPNGAPGRFRPIELHLGKGSNPLEVAVARSDGRPPAGEVRSLWEKRHRKRASPLLCVALYQHNETWRAAVCGPAGEAPRALLDLDIGQTALLLRRPGRARPPCGNPLPARVPSRGRRRHTGSAECWHVCDALSEKRRAATCRLGRSVRGGSGTGYFIPIARWSRRLATRSSAGIPPHRCCEWMGRHAPLRSSSSKRRAPREQDSGTAGSAPRRTRSQPPTGTDSRTRS